jgi:hypothetical protein
MNKLGFCFSCIASLLGVSTLILTQIINKLMPKIGYVVFQAAGHSYATSDYLINFKLVNNIAIVLIIGGIVMAYKFYKKEFNTK